MKSIIHTLAVLALAITVFSCSDDQPAAVTGTDPLLHDAQYYPDTKGTFWRYRIDTTGSNGQTVRDVERRNARIGGSITLDSLTYTIQETEIIAGATSRYDTIYIRKDDRGVWMSSPSMQLLSLFGGFSGFSGFPKEFLIVPANLASESSWDIIRFDFTAIPLVQIYYHVTAAYLGRETIQTDTRTFRECARIRISLDARFPNPANPQDILNPLIIRDNAEFWLARPLGLVVGDGAESIFALLGGRVPFSLEKKRMHMEVLGFDIAQPPEPCAAGAK